MVSALDYSTHSSNFPIVSSGSPSLSSATTVNRWINIAFDQAFILWPFIDRDSFQAYAKQLSERGTLDTDDANNDQLGLFYAVVALGQRHDPYLVSSEGGRSQTMETRG